MSSRARCRLWTWLLLAINQFEAELTKRGTTIIKFFLHISTEEQLGRLLDRLGEPSKRWKISPQDLTVRRYWRDYQQAYAAALARCSTSATPCYIIPSNRKWCRHYAIAQLLLETLEDMKLAYPDPRLDVRSLKQNLNDVH